MSRLALTVVSGDDLDEYPISARDRLDSHYFLQFNHDRFDHSNMRRLSYRDPEVGFFGLQLIFKSHGESPLGTLPADHDSIAFLLGLSLDKWMGLAERKFNPLYKWHHVRCDNGEIRLAHPVVQEVMELALQSHRDHKASNEDRAIAVRRKRLREVLKSCGCSEALCGDDHAVGWIDEWLLEHHRGQRRMPQFQTSISRALKAAAAAGVLGHPNRRV